MTNKNIKEKNIDVIPVVCKVCNKNPCVCKE